ncbi:MAG: hypothetical protein AB1668_04355 [Nanoarchaeota archaeon]
MKKSWLFLFVIIILILLTTFASAVVTTSHSSPEIKVLLLSQTPDPVEPGQVVEVKFKVENNGTALTQDAIIEALPQFPFTLYNDVAKKNIGKLRASQTGADAAIVSFKLKVDEQALEEDTELELKVHIGDAAIVYTHNEFLIDIQTHDAVLDVTSISVIPEQIAPGGTGEVDIMVKNLADSLLKDIKFKLDFSSSSVPLAPYQSSSERRIASLQSKYQNSLRFKLIAKPDATPGLYKIPLNISYNDEKGNSYLVEDFLAMTIGEAPRVKAYLKKSTVQKAGEEGKITLEVANAGNTEVKFVEMTLMPSDDYQLITTRNYFYLGNIASDDTQSEEIDIYVNKVAKKSKKAIIPLHLKYVDANNKVFKQDVDLELNVYSSSQLKKFGLLQSSYAWIYVLLIILALSGFFGYRKYWEKFSLKRNNK